MFIDAIDTILRTGITALIIYSLFIVSLRITGKRTLSKFSAFDFVVTIALGSTMATTILSKEVTVLQGLTALIFLTLLQFIITWISIRFPKTQSFFRASPTVVFYHGEFKRRAMLDTRITEREILQSMRKAGIGDFSKIVAVIMETNGELSVIAHAVEGDTSTLKNLV